MPPSPLKLRSDLIISEQETAAGTAYVVKDPTTGRFFRFEGPEHFILRQLDGATPLEMIRQRCEAEFGAPLEEESARHFLGTLARLGLLEGEGRPPSEPRGRIRGSLLYLRFKAFDPDPLLERLAPRVRGFFTAEFLALSATSILLAFLVAIANSDKIGRELLGLFRPETLLLAWITILVVTTCHEFAHGLACKHFGGEVHEMGFLLLFFQPAFYCNVSDAWLFPERSKRMWVMFAGGYFELFLWALATLSWRLV